MCGISGCENREVPWLPVLSMMPRPGWIAGWHIGRGAGREGNAEAVSPR
jgi:hypothetical protein